MLWYRRPILTTRQSNRLKDHKYAADNESLLDPYFQPWWNYVVTLLPIWMAPNLITLLGLIINVVTASILIISCPTATEELSGWVPFIAGLGVFIYQTLDAVDGKQARRTGSSNALGELFDHGCDSLSGVMLIVSTMCTVSLGYLSSYWLMYGAFVFCFLFYLAHWQTYVTGRMRFAKIDVTEIQVALITILWITAVFNSEIWSYQVFGFLSLRWTILASVTVFALLSLPGTVNRILFGGAGRNGSTVADSSVIQPVIPFFLSTFPALFLALNSSENVFERNPILYIITFGLVTSKITIKLIIAQMTKSELGNLDFIFMCPFVLFANQYKGPFIAEKQLLIMNFVFVVIDYVLFNARCCLDICNTTGWYMFKIRPQTTTSVGTSFTGSRSKQHQTRMVTSLSVTSATKSTKLSSSSLSLQRNSSSYGERTLSWHH